MIHYRYCPRLGCIPTLVVGMCLVFILLLACEGNATDKATNKATTTAVTEDSAVLHPTYPLEEGDVPEDSPYWDCHTMGNQVCGEER